MALFDTLRLARRLRDHAGFTPEHAEATAEALEEALGRDAEVASKPDIQAAIDQLRAEIVNATLRLTIRMGSMIAAATAIPIAIKFFAH